MKTETDKPKRCKREKLWISVIKEVFASISVSMNAGAARDGEGVQACVRIKRMEVFVFSLNVSSG